MPALHSNIKYQLCKKNFAVQLRIITEGPPYTWTINAQNLSSSAFENTKSPLPNKKKEIFQTLAITIKIKAVTNSKEGYKNI